MLCCRRRVTPQQAIDLQKPTSCLPSHSLELHFADCPERLSGGHDFVLERALHVQLSLDTWPEGFASLAFDNMISSSEHTGAGFELRENVIMNNRGRGMLIKAGNGVIEANTIIRPTFWPIQVSALYPTLLKSDQ